MAFNVDTGFDNETLLKDVREEVINKLASRVTDLRSRMTKAETAVDSATANTNEKKITLGRINTRNPIELDLTGMFREGSDLALVDTKGTKVDNVTEIYFRDSSVTGAADGKATISYDWDNLVKDNQEHLTVGKTGETATATPKALYFKGNSVEVENGTNITTVTIPDPTPPLKAQINTGAEQNIESVKVIGNTANSSIDGNTLNIYLPTEGSGGIANQNFKGFFSSLGDIISEVKDPISGRSYAFAKDSKYGGDYYTPYVYLNGSWTELKQDPALLYSPTTSSTTQGVFSIKPDARITIDSQGQLDLSGLSVKPDDQYFHGFYNSQALLEADVPRPVKDHSFAYVRHANGGWIGKVYSEVSGKLGWNIVAPISGFSLVDSPSSTTQPAVVYGIYKNDQWKVDTNGLISLDLSAVDTPVEITNPETGNIVKQGAFNTVQYKGGSGNVFLNGKKLFIEHPQRVIEYNEDFEDDFNDSEYMGNIYYDKTSRCWMGWGIPEAAGGVDKKWTRIAHPKMSEEVKDLVRRLPKKAPKVSAGILGDAPAWQHNSWTYVEKDDPQLPDDFKERCGAYFVTIIQDITNDWERPQERFQICYADEQNSNSYVRTWNKGASEGSSDYGWRPWVKLSISPQELVNHNLDPGAHKSSHKFYKVLSPDISYQALKTKGYYLYDNDMLLVADSHGSSTKTSDHVLVPYDGNFRFSGKFTLDGWGSSDLNTQWMFKILKANGSTSTEIGDFVFSHTSTSTSKKLPPIQWETGALSLKAGDRIVFQFRCLSDTTFATNHPNLYLVPLRTYIVMEDENTNTGSRLAEMHRRTSGMLNANKATGVNVHYAAGSSGTIRVYGGDVINTFSNMTKVKG